MGSGVIFRGHRVASGKGRRQLQQFVHDGQRADCGVPRAGKELPGRLPRVGPQLRMHERAGNGGLEFARRPHDVGHAAPSLAALTPFHDFGIGLRWLIPQLNSSVVRIDWAIATQDSPSGLTRAGLPGRASAGFQQVF